MLTEVTQTRAWVLSRWFHYECHAAVEVKRWICIKSIPSIRSVLKYLITSRDSLNYPGREHL